MKKKTNNSVRAKKRMKKPSKKTLKFFKRILKKVIPKKRVAARKKKIKRVEIFGSIQDLSPTPKIFMDQSSELPEKYGENCLVLLVRDPWWLYSYWEVQPQRETEIFNLIRSRGLSVDRKVLRIYDVTDVSLPSYHTSFDIEVEEADNWVVDVGGPNKYWVAELGIRTVQGIFFALIRSNIVKTPRCGVSEVVDEEWMLPGGIYWKHAGFGISSLAVQGK